MKPLTSDIPNVVGRFGQGDAETVLSLYNYLRSLTESWWREKSGRSNIVHGC